MSSEASPKKDSVSTEVNKNETNGDVHPDSSSKGEASPKPQRRSRSKSLPRGNYTLVGIDIDTTGRRLIDEIVQLSAYSPKSEFSQYIMPYMNLNPAARQRHQLRVITVGFFRMLKSMTTYKPIKTKSEIAALLEFLDWLEKLRKQDHDSQGVILIYHEKRKFLPYMLLEAFKKYELLDRFLSSVRSFANSYDYASDKCANTVKYLNLRELSKVLLNNNEEEDKNGKTKGKERHSSYEGNASVRARLAFEITQHLVKGEQPEGEIMSEEKEMAHMSNVIYEFSHPVSQEIAELRNQRKLLEMQNSLRPIFVQYFKTTLYHRVKAVTYRRLLAENGYEYDVLQKLWNDEKREGFVNLMEKLEGIESEQKAEMVELLDAYFDPEKTPIQPPKKHRRRKSNPRTPRRSRRSRNNSRTSKGGVTGGGDATTSGDENQKTDGATTPDSGTEEVTKVMITPTDTQTVINDENVKAEPVPIAAN